jgi:hypothetical protein
VGNNFYNSSIPEDEKIYELSDFYVNDTMSYNAPPLSRVSSLLNLPKGTQIMDKELSTIQGMLAQITRPIDTLAHELVKYGVTDQDWCDQTMGTLYTIRVMLERTATQVTRVRQQSVIRSKGYFVEAKTTAEPIVSMDMLSEAKKLTDSIKESSRSYKNKSSWKRGNYSNKEKDNNRRGRSRDNKREKSDTRHNKSSSRRRNSRSPSPSGGDTNNNRSYSRYKGKGQRGKSNN